MRRVSFLPVVLALGLILAACPGRDDRQEVPGAEQQPAAPAPVEPGVAAPPAVSPEPTVQEPAAATPGAPAPAAPGAAAPATTAPQTTAPAPAPPPAASPGTAGQLPPGVTAQMVSEGQQLYGTLCVACHGAGGTGTPIGPALNDQNWIHITGEYQEIVNISTTGVDRPRQYPAPMPARGGGNFTDAQMRAIAAYVYTLSHGR